MIGQTVSHYKILEKLGEGGMGVVYKAEDLNLKRFVALKFLPAHLRDRETEHARFLQEARTASALNHPNVCTIFDIQQYEDQPFIIMEYVDGETLRAKLQKLGSDSRLGMDQVLSYAIQVGEALHEAHAQGIVHRDIKCENVMVNSKDQMKVMDFGLAKLKGSLKLTKTSSTVGTLAYMSPEQIQGGEVDTRSDIFSFGVLFYELLTGHLPFRGEHEAAMVYSIVNEEPFTVQKYREDAPPEVEHVIRRLLEKSAEDRYQHIDDAVSELRRMKRHSSKVHYAPLTHPAGSTIERGAETERKTSKVPVQRSRKYLWVGGGIALAAVLLYFFFPQRSLEINPNFTTRIVRLPFTDIGYPGLSRDGNWIAFPAVNSSKLVEIYFMNASGGEPHRVTNDSSLDVTQVGTDISPDGSRIAYDITSRKDGHHGTYVISSLGGTPQLVTEAADMERWRPDGNRIGFIWLSGNPIPSSSRKPEFWTVNPDGSDKKREFIDSLGGYGSFAFSWSPDGKQVAWLRAYPQNYQEIFLHDLATGQERQLTFDKKIIDDVYWGTTEQIFFSSDRSGSMNLWAINSSSGKVYQVTRGSGPDQAVVVSAEGKKLIYLQTQDISNIHIADLQNNEVRQETNDEDSHVNPALSPDGKHIAFLSTETENRAQMALMIMERGGGNPRRLLSGLRSLVKILWSPDGSTIAFGASLVPQPPESLKTYLLRPFQTDAQRIVANGVPRQWSGNDKLIIDNRRFTSVFSVSDNLLKRLGTDSTKAYLTSMSGTLLYNDYRDGHGDWWLASEDGKGTPKRILGPGYTCTISPSGIYVYYQKDQGAISRKSLINGKVEQLPITADLYGVTFSYDDRYAVYSDAYTRGKLVMIENLFQ